jgi:hypothetical protein
MKPRFKHIFEYFAEKRDRYWSEGSIRVLFRYRYDFIGVSRRGDLLIIKYVVHYREEKYYRDRTLLTYEKK